MQHHAHAHSRANIRRTSGQIPQPLVEGIRHLAFDQIVDLVDLFPCRLQVESAVHDLDAQMIFFVHHQTELLVGIDGHAARPLPFREFTADELSFNQELPIDGWQ